MNLNQKGIAPMAIAIIVIVVLIIGVVIGYYINKFYAVEQSTIPSPPVSETVTIVLLKIDPDECDPSKVDECLVEVQRKVAQPSGNQIRDALTELFSIKTPKDEETGYYTFLYPSTLKVDNIRTENSKTIIDLSGILSGIGSMADPFIIPQVTKTISQYTSDFKITLNGSEKNWRCALDVTGSCE